MYQKLPIGTDNPGLIVILIDQSGSMADPYGGSSKQDFAALAVNRCIYEIMNACKSGVSFRDRCHIAVIGYGKVTEIVVAGRPSELGQKVKRTQVFKQMQKDGAGGLTEIDKKLPIWVEPQADNGTPMEKAFDLATELIQAWINEHPNNFPPVIINITDGAPNEPAQAEAAAQRLLSQGTSDGGVLLLNAHVADSAGTEIKLPSDEKSLPDQFALLLFRMSSVLPEPMLAAAQNAGFAPGPGARGFLMNAGAESLTKLLVFGSAYAR